MLSLLAMVVAPSREAFFWKLHSLPSQEGFLLRAFFQQDRSRPLKKASPREPSSRELFPPPISDIYYIYVCIYV